MNNNESLDIDDLLGPPEDLEKEMSAEPGQSSVPLRQPSEAPAMKKMPEEAQKFTYVMARQMHANESARLIRDGWNFAEKKDDKRKETPNLLPFNKLDYAHKQPYLDSSATAIMILLDGNFTMEPSLPETPIPSEIRRASELALTAGGMTEGQASEAIAAIEAAGFVIRKGPSREEKMMDAYFDMVLASSGGQISGPDEAETVILSTVNMAKKENLPLDDINRFIERKSREYGVTVPAVTIEDERRRIFGEIKETYYETYVRVNSQTPSFPIAIPGTSKSIISEGDFLRIYGDAVRQARAVVVPRLERMRDEEMRDYLYTAIDAFEKGEFFERNRREAMIVGGSWKDEMTAAMDAAAVLIRRKEEHAQRTERWRSLRWYEKMFIPKPSFPEKEIRTLERQRDAAITKMQEAYRTDHEPLRENTPEGTVTSVENISLSVKGRPVLSISRKLEGETVSHSRMLYFGDGSIRNIQPKAGAAAAFGEQGEKRISAAMEAKLLDREETLRQELAAATVLSRQHRLSDETRRELELKKDMLQIRQDMKHRRADLVSASETARATIDKQRREKKDVMPALHPNLAGDITPKDVEILKAYRLQGGRGKDLQNIIDALKEKKQIVIDGSMTYRRTYAYDPADVPRNRVYIGLRLGSDGHILVFNPVSGADLGPVRRVFSSSKNLDFGGALRRHAASAQGERKKEDRVVRQGS